MTTSGPAATMLIADVDVFLGAFGAADPAHPALHEWLNEHLAAGERFGVSEPVLSAVVRISTNHRSYPTPATSTKRSRSVRGFARLRRHL